MKTRAVILTQAQLVDYDFTPAAEYIYDVLSSLQRLKYIDTQPYKDVDDVKEAIKDLINKINFDKDWDAIGSGCIEILWKDDVIQLDIRFSALVEAEEDPEEQGGFVDLMRKIERGCETAFDIAAKFSRTELEK